MCTAIAARGPRLDGTAVRLTIADWREALGVALPVGVERISRFQVTGPDGRAGAAMVGVVCDRTTATIYHTRQLTAEDIVHELLHVAHPAWSEERVTLATDRLILGARSVMPRAA